MAGQILVWNDEDTYTHITPVCHPNLSRDLLCTSITFVAMALMFAVQYWEASDGITVYI